MRDGFVTVAAVTPQVRVADVAFNIAACEEAARAAAAQGAKVVVLPELAVTGYTCEDLFWQDALISAARHGVLALASALADVDALVLVGAPLSVDAKLYNCAVALAHGRVLGVIPKRAIPTYNEFYEGRHFARGPQNITYLDFGQQERVPFGTEQLFACPALPGLTVAAELCEDLWVPDPPSVSHALAGARLVCNLSASTAVVGKAAYRRDLVVGQSARLVCAYVYAGAGPGESTADAVYAGHNLVAENGVLLAETAPFAGNVALSEIDVASLTAERRRMSTFPSSTSAADRYVTTLFDLEIADTRLTRPIDPMPFVPASDDACAERCEEVLSIQACGLARRLAHTGSTRAVVGISGGLDSTLALLVTARAFVMSERDNADIIAITMPGFGTTDRTHDNAAALARALGTTLREIPIAAAVRQHFADIGHDESVRDVTYENAQARERTQVLMDVANQEGALVVGTGDLSELALGWATYNGDHMSMYGVNAGVPKTLVRHLVRHVANTTLSAELTRVLVDVLDTPVSPELLPANGNGTIAQQTEDLVGPYELHDFFLYQALRRGFSPRKVYRLARQAWGGRYDDATILAWLRVFYRRFFAQQFKRSCLPDGPKVGSVSLSPRGDLRMPSDACATLWLTELEEL